MPDDFDPFAGFSGGVEEPGVETFPTAGALFDPSGTALQFGPPPVGGPDGLTDPGHGDVSWYDAPHQW